MNYPSPSLTHTLYLSKLMIMIKETNSLKYQPSNIHPTPQPQSQCIGVIKMKNVEYEF